MDTSKTIRRFVAFFIYLWCFCPAIAQPVITEVMFRPALTTGEFVEFYNSGKDSLDPSSLWFRDGYTTTSLVHVSGSEKIAPFSYALLIDKDHFDGNGIPLYEIPAGLSVFKTSNASIGNGLGNTSDFICILDAASGDTLSKVSWTNVDVDAGISIEKRRIEGPVKDIFPSVNWVLSVYPNGTPGLPFTGTIPPLSDAGIYNLIQLSDTSFSFQFKNAGVLNLTDITITIQVPDIGFLENLPLSILAAGDSVLVQHVLPRFPPGNYQLSVSLNEPDENTENDSKTISWIVSDRPETDFRIIDLSIKPDFPVSNEKLTAEFTVTNRGFRKLEPAEVLVTINDVFIASVAIPVLFSDDTLKLSTGTFSLLTGIQNLKMEWQGEDSDAEGNFANLSFFVNNPWPFESVLLTEIMANPDGSDAGNEFIEIFNTHPTDSIPISFLSLLIGPDSLKLEPVNADHHFLKPGQTGIIFSPAYFDFPEKLYDDFLDTSQAIIIRTETAFTLKNKSGEISITGDKTASDSFHWYRDSGDGKSWERLDSRIPFHDRFWDISSSINGTPGFWDPPYLPATALQWINTPELSVTGRLITVSATIKHVGADRLDGLNAEFCIQYANYSDQREKVFRSVDISGAFQFGDTIRLSEQINCAFSGRLQMVAGILLNNETLMSMTTDFTMDNPSGAVVINEVFQGNDQIPPFIEIRNNGSRNFHPDGWRIQVDESVKSSLYSAPEGVAPGKTGLLIYKADTTFFKATGKFPVFTAASFPDLFSGGLVRLIDQNSGVCDSVFLEREQFADYSLERVDSAAVIFWRKSRFPGGTAGYPNSWPVSFTDLSISVENEIHGLVNQPIPVTVQLINTGLSELLPVDLLIVSGPDTSRMTIDQLPRPGESVPINFSLPPLDGDCWLTVQAATLGDERPENDEISAFVHLHHPASSIVISEVMFDPPVNAFDNSIGDWIEVENVSGGELNIQGWSISDRAGTVWYLPDGFSLHENDFLVIASDSSFLQFYQFPDSCPIVIVNGSLNLNADEDVVYLMDQWGWIVDSVSYSDAWHHPDLKETKGISLERRSVSLPASHPGNWMSSGHPLGGTPGYSNSAMVNPEFSSDGFRISPKIFFPDDGQVCEFSWNFQSGIHSTEIRIFDRIGREIRELKPYGPASATGIIFWDGRRENGNRLPVGPYVVLQTARNLQTGDIIQKKAVVILARSL